MVMKLRAFRLKTRPAARYPISVSRRNVQAEGIPPGGGIEDLDTPEALRINLHSRGALLLTGQFDLDSDPLPLSPHVPEPCKNFSI
jgi:hypothetical protein